MSKGGRMIEALTITGIKYDVDEKTKKYVTKKLVHLIVISRVMLARV